MEHWSDTFFMDFVGIRIGIMMGDNSEEQKCYVPCLSGNVSDFAFRNYNLDRKLKTQI
jgi:hypothetical protein